MRGKYSKSIIKTPVSYRRSGVFILTFKIFRKHLTYCTAQKMKFSIKDFFSMRIWSRLLKKSLLENFIFCAVLMNMLILELTGLLFLLKMLVLYLIKFQERFNNLLVIKIKYQIYLQLKHDSFICGYSFFFFLFSFSFFEQIIYKKKPKWNGNKKNCSIFVFFFMFKKQPNKQFSHDDVKKCGKSR